MEYCADKSASQVMADLEFQDKTYYIDIYVFSIFII